MNYKVVCALLAAAQSQVGWCSARALSRLFVAVDIICVVLQFGGSVCATLAIALRENLVRDIANGLLVTSFVVQLVLNLAFTALVAWMYQQPQFAPKSSATVHVGEVWTSVITSVSLIWVRNLYRATEGFANAAGDGSLVANEGLFIAFDTVPIALCCILFCVRHYGFLLPVNDEELARQLPPHSLTAVQPASAALSAKDSEQLYGV